MLHCSAGELWKSLEHSCLDGFGDAVMHHKADIWFVDACKDTHTASHHPDLYLRGMPADFVQSIYYSEQASQHVKGREFASHPCQRQWWPPQPGLPLSATGSGSGCAALASAPHGNSRRQSHPHSAPACQHQVLTRGLTLLKNLMLNTMHHAGLPYICSVLRPFARYACV